MPKRIAVNAIFLVREGKRVKVKPGTEIELTTEELDHIKQVAPDSVRNPINESGSTAGRSAQQPAKANKGYDKAEEV